LAVKRTSLELTAMSPFDGADIRRLLAHTEFVENDPYATLDHIGGVRPSFP
jgi:hypothetical protein